MKSRHEKDRWNQDKIFSWSSKGSKDDAETTQLGCNAFQILVVENWEDSAAAS